MSQEENNPLNSLDEEQIINIWEEKKEDSLTSSVQWEQKEESILNQILQNTQQEEEKKEEIIDIKNFDSLVQINTKKELDYIRIEPLQENVELSFVKDGKEIEKRNISYPLYSQIVLTLKNLSKMNLAETTKVQDGNGEYIFDSKLYKLITKVSPSQFWEKAFLKIKSLEEKIKKEKKQIPLSKILWIFWAIAFVSLILWVAFITFIVLNAKTVDDVKFFYSLWINLNDINTFILKVVTVIFSILLFLETVFLAISLFKTILTKKEDKRKKTAFFLLSIFILIITFSTWTAWMIIDKKIKNLPNWQEVAYWDIQIFDNAKLISDKFDKWWALLKDMSNLIWPITLKYDLSLFTKRETQKWFEIQRYIWDFGDGKQVEELNPTIIKTFDKKWTYDVSLIVQEKDSTGKEIEKKVEGVKSLSIGNIVKINETKLKNWWKTVEFDASDLKDLWRIEWYFEENLNNPVWEGEVFKPSKIFFEEQLIGMYIKKEGEKATIFDKIFIVWWEKWSSLEGQITYEQSLVNDLDFTFKVENVKNDFGDGFVSEFKWIIWEREFTKKADVTNFEKSSEIKHTFLSYWKYTIIVRIKDGNGNEKSITKEINITKNLKIINPLSIYNELWKIDDMKYDTKTHEYFLNLWIPTKLKFDARLLKTDNYLYFLKEINWDFNNDGDKDTSGKTAEYIISSWWNYIVSVEYTFQHRKIEDDIIKITEKIYIEWIKKEAILDLKIKKESDYVPVVVKFDASLSQVRDDNIVKFIYDYGDGIKEERDAINPWHNYTKEWDYKVKLTVVTEKWKEYSTEKSLILKPKPQNAEIGLSMKEAPIWQAIDFTSDESEGQIVSYFWDFWDGITSTEANPSHSYKKAGNYDVKLRLWFINNNFQEDTISINITEK